MPVQKLNRAIKYRAYPTSEQQVLFTKTFGCVRFIWNHMLIDAQQFLDEAGTFFVPTPAKYKKEFPFLKEVDSLALANTQLDLKDANKRHLESPKAVGVPRLKSKHRSGMSYTTNNKKTQSKDGKIKNTVYVVGNLVHLPKVGNVKVKVHRQPDADWVLKGATVSCTRSGKYFVFWVDEDVTCVKSMNDDYLNRQKAITEKQLSDFSSGIFLQNFDYIVYGKRLASKSENTVEFVENTIVSHNKQELEVVASGMEAMGLSVETGYYDPDDESSVDVPKQLIGFHYVVLKKNTL